MVGGVGQDFLVAGHAGVEDDLAIDLSAGAKGLAGEYGAVLERKLRDIHRAGALLWNSCRSAGCAVDFKSLIYIEERLARARAGRGSSFGTRSEQIEPDGRD